MNNLPKSITYIILILLTCTSQAKLHEQDVRWVESQMQRYQIPGASIAVIREGRIDWRAGFGYADKDKKIKVTPHTLFQAASISKPVTAFGALTLLQRKGLSLDTPVHRLLKSWQLPKYGEHDEQNVTVRMLLDHSSGIDGFRFHGYSYRTKLPTLLDVLNGKPPANTPAVTLVRKPGSQFEYCPAAYAILQQLMVDIEGKPFSSLMQEQVLTPFQMADSTFDAPLSSKQFNTIALPYFPDGTRVQDGPHYFVNSAGGGLWTTATDLARFMIGLQRSKLKSIILKPSFDAHMGLGMEVNGQNFSHSGFQTGYLAYLTGRIDNRSGVVVLINSAPIMEKDARVKQFDFIKAMVERLNSPISH